jgi:TM2 domain-containing membrane protein YozV
MLILFKLRNILFGALIIFCFLIPSKEGIFSQTLDLSLPCKREYNQQFRHPISLHDLTLNSTTQDTLKTDTTLRKPIDKKFRMKKSPWVAVGFSALLPGAGQFYNKSYWKIPVILGIVGYLGYEFFDNDKKYRDYRDQYSVTQTTENPAGDPNLKTLREFYFDQRNDFVWYFAIVYVINLVDAYVDAHLFDFDISEDKLTRFGTTDKEYRLNVKVKF